MLTIFGGRVFDIKSFLIDERIPDGWESRARNRWGLTIFKFNWTTIPLELSINEKKYRAKRALQKAETSQEALNPPQLWNICTAITIIYHHFRVDTDYRIFYTNSDSFCFNFHLFNYISCLCIEVVFYGISWVLCFFFVQLCRQVPGFTWFDFVLVIGSERLPFFVYVKS